MKHTLLTDDFYLDLEPCVFEKDILLSTNTILKVDVGSDGFSANTSMDVDIKEFARFAQELMEIYNNLSGEAMIQEPYGMHMYIKFSGNGKGYIDVKGYLHRGSKVGYEQTLEFQNQFDQTYLKDFCQELFHEYKKYLN